MSATKVEVNEGLTRKVAHLARLELSNEEVALFTRQLDSILKYVEKLGDVQTAGVEPLTHFETEAPLREDQVEEFPRAPDGSPKILGSAPEVLDNGFKVPPIL